MTNKIELKKCEECSVEVYFLNQGRCANCHVKMLANRLGIRYVENNPQPKDVHE